MAAPTCPACGAVQPGGATACIRCRRPLPSPAEEPALALPAEAMPPPAAALPPLPQPLSGEAMRLTKSHRLAAYGPGQRLAFALLARTLQEYRGDRVVFILALLFIPLLFVAGLAFAVLTMSLAAWTIALVDRGGSGSSTALLYAVPFLVLIFARGLRSLAEEAKIPFQVREGAIDGWRLGRLDEVFQVAAPSTLGLFLGCCFGFMWGLLYHAAGHTGLAIDGSLGTCFLLTLDNFLHGVLLDTCELYDLRVGEKLTHTTLSATVFYLFRLAFDALVLLLGYELFQRWRLRRFFAGYPWDPQRVEEVLAWLEAACADRDRWPRRFFDEFVFLVLVKEYIRGHFTLVRQMSEQFSWLAVPEPVRRAFIDAEGKAVFVGRYRDD